MGPTVTEPVQDPLAVLLLNNWLYITTVIVPTQAAIPEVGGCQKQILSWYSFWYKMAQIQMVIKLKKHISIIVLNPYVVIILPHSETRVKSAPNKTKSLCDQPNSIYFWSKDKKSHFYVN